jgi:general secretion pathway protein J
MMSRGFTLLELLVAMSIFSVIGLGSYQMLQTIVESHDKVRTVSERYTKVNLAFSMIQRDFNQFVPRPVRDAYGEPLAPIVFGDNDYAVEFTRTGWRNPAGRLRSQLQRVAYSVDYEEETLTRHFWEVLDRAEDSEPVSQIIMEGVTDFRVTGYQGDESDDLASDFELDDVGGAAPLAVEVVVASDTLGEIRRIFQMVEPWQQGSGQQIDNDDNVDDDNTGEDDPSDNDQSDDNQLDNNGATQSPVDGDRDG